MKIETKLSVGIASVVLSAVLLAGCKAAASHGEVSPPTEHRNPLAIKVSPSLREQIKLGELRSAEVAASLRVAGWVEADATRLARIGSPMTGRITDLRVMEGEKVKRGQVLATLHSTELSDAQFGFVKAFSQLQLSERAATRAKQLLNADVIGAAELQRREAEVLQAHAELSALRQQLKVLGMSDESIHQLQTNRKLNSEYEVVASIDGTVLERKVTIGQIVQPAEIEFIIADLSNVWLVADVPEQSAGDIKIGRSIEAEIPAFPGETIKGNLSFVSATVNPETRTVRTRMDLRNPQGRYKPAMLATMLLKENAQKRQVLPVTAFVREDNTDNVFVQTAPDTFVLRKITVSQDFEDVGVVQAGVNPGEHVVVDGAFHLNNERKRLAVEGGD